METKVQLDEVSWRILEELQESARMSFTELARRVGLTAPAVADRVRRLEEAGVISGYRLEVDHARLGLPLKAFVRIRCGEGKCADLGEFAGRLPEVLECHRITGTESYVLQAAVRDVAHLESLIDRLMPYGETTTSIVLSSPVTHRAIERDLAREAVADADRPARTGT
ncbi:MAG: Lrp/AsnC family transcriptional regulator [Actinobacteria bacterium]|nr:Lrp/AsnC family transcriptional regulator [Actinomycetota bacterium]